MTIQDSPIHPTTDNVATPPLWLIHNSVWHRSADIVDTGRTTLCGLNVDGRPAYHDAEGRSMPDCATCELQAGAIVETMLTDIAEAHEAETIAEHDEPVPTIAGYRVEALDAMPADSVAKLARLTVLQALTDNRQLDLYAEQRNDTDAGKIVRYCADRADVGILNYQPDRLPMGPADGRADIGGQFIQRLGYGLDSLEASRYALVNMVTVSDLLARWRQVATEWREDALTASRKLRAGARTHGWTDSYDAEIGELLMSEDLRHPSWRPTVERFDELPTGKTTGPDLWLARSGISWTADSVRDTLTSALDFVALCNVPATPHELTYGTTVDDIVAAIKLVQRWHDADMTAIGEKLYELATGTFSSWCREYEGTMSELRSTCHIGDYWQDRTREYVVTVTETYTVTVEAQDEDDARELAMDIYSDNGPDDYDVEVYEA